MYNLSKKEKKTAREIIEKGLQFEYKTGISRLKEIIDNWNQNMPNHRDTYHKLYKTLTNFDEQIAFRYDNMTGSKYLSIIAGQLADKVITIDDLNKFSEETKEIIIRWNRINEEF